MTLFNTDADDLEAECRKIDQVIFDNGGIDFMLLGLGMNGHLGLNEPGADFHNYAHMMGLRDVTKSVSQKYFSLAVSRNNRQFDKKYPALSAGYF